MATLAPCYNTRRIPGEALTWDRPAASPKQAEAKSATTPTRKLRVPSFNFARVLFVAVNTLHGICNWGLLATSGLFVALFALQFPHATAWDSTWWVLRLRGLGDPVIVTVLVWIKTQWPNFSLTGYLPLALAVAAGSVKVGLSAAFLPILSRLRRRAASSNPLSVATATADGSVEVAQVDSEQARDYLLKRYREIESALRESKRKRCVFLSIDVVGSTRMKESERELPVTITFQAYMKMLEEIFRRHSAWKESWTPDGVMVCFLELDAAVAAAQEVLRRLRTFNRTENLLRSRLSVRCGLNEGEVPIFEDSKLEKIAHRAIDISGHMQKNAKPDTLWLSAEVHKKLKKRSGFRPTGTSVDGLQAFEWSPSLALPEQPPAVLPPPAKKLGNSDPTWA
jgi:class 3 adenylate cyclase